MLRQIPETYEEKAGEIDLLPCPFCGTDEARFTSCQELEACEDWKCPEESHYHAVVCSFSGKGCGASTGFFPENTWYVKYGNHQIGSYAKTLVNKIFFEEGFNVHSDPAFPQFLLRDEATNTASPLTEENCADITGAPRFTAKLFGVFFKGFARLLALCKTVSGWFNK